jgi:hypothetical protein
LFREHSILFKEHSILFSVSWTDAREPPPQLQEALQKKGTKGDAEYNLQTWVPKTRVDRTKRHILGVELRVHSHSASVLFREPSILFREHSNIVQGTFDIVQGTFNIAQGACDIVLLPLRSPVPRCCVSHTKM